MEKLEIWPFHFQSCPFAQQQNENNLWNKINDGSYARFLFWSKNDDPVSSSFLIGFYRNLDVTEIQ